MHIRLGRHTVIQSGPLKTALDSRHLNVAPRDQGDQMLM
jgi:hypothetical protein